LTTKSESDSLKQETTFIINLDNIVKGHPHLESVNVKSWQLLEPLHIKVVSGGQDYDYTLKMTPTNERVILRGVTRR